MPKSSHEHYKKLQKELGDFPKDTLHGEGESDEANENRKRIFKKDFNEFIENLRKDLCLE